MSSKTITLKYPVTVGNERIDRVTLRRPKTADLRLLDQHSGVEGSIAMVARLSGLEPLVIEEMDAADFFAISGVADDFLDNSQSTGAM